VLLGSGHEQASARLTSRISANSDSSRMCRPSDTIPSSAAANSALTTIGWQSVLAAFSMRHQVDRGTDHGEIEPVGGADIAVMNRADMQRDNNVEGRLAVQCGVISKTADRRNRVPSRGEGVIRDRGDGTWLGDRKSAPRRLGFGRSCPTAANAQADSQPRPSE
jgi:hypothetical protein